MSYNGSGTFNINSAGQPVVAGTVISATAFNALTADLGVGLSTAITKDGQTTTTARITFAQGVTSSLTTDSSSTTTGSIITAGGVGIAKALFVGTTLNVTGASTLAAITGTFNGTVGATTANTGAFTTLSASGTTTLSGNQIISVTDNTNAALRITQLGTGNALLVEDSTNPDATPFVIDASGVVVRGNLTALTTPGFASTTGLTPGIQNHATSLSNSAVSAFIWNATASSSPQYILSRSRGASAGTFGIVSSGDNIGGLTFNGDDGAAFVTAASIVSQVDGTPGTNDMPGRLVFSTTADGAATPTERMRIDSSGNLLVGVTTANANGGVLQLKSGITFPATAVAATDANTLDDYEEGTWTPSVGGTATYTTQTGFYTKTGRQVTIWADLTILLIGTGSTSQISGNPFTPAAGITYMPGSVYWENLAISETNLITVTQGGSGNIWFSGRATAAATIDNVVAILGNTTRVRFCITYNV
jgi:hypothetical protein